MANSNTIVCHYDHEKAEWSLGVAIAYLVVGLAAFISNIFIDYVIWKQGLLHLVGHMFILSLSVSDIIQGILVSSLNSIELTTGIPLTTSPSWCRISAGLCLLAIESTVYNILVITIDRMVAIFNPFHYHRIMSHRNAGVCIGLLWTFAVVWCSLPFFGWALETTCLRPAYSMCDWGLVLDPRYFIVTSIMVIASVTLVAICQATLFIVAIGHLKAAKTRGSTRESTARGLQSKVSRNIMLIVLTFAVTYIPWFALVIYTVKTGKAKQEYIIACNSLIYLNSLVNPWVYALNDRLIRAKAKQCLMRRSSNAINPTIIITIGRVEII